MLEQALVRIFTDITDAKLENTANLFLAFSNFLDDEAPESSEQESDDLIEGEDPEREALKLKKFATKKKIAQAIAKKIITRVKKIIRKFKKIKGKRSVDAINSVIDATRQGVQDFGGSAESAIQFIGDELQSLKQDLVQLSTDIVDAKFNFISDDDDVIPDDEDVILKVSDDGSDEMPEIEVPEVEA